MTQTQIKCHHLNLVKINLVLNHFNKEVSQLKRCDCQLVIMEDADTKDECQRLLGRLGKLTQELDHCVVR